MAESTPNLSQLAEVTLPWHQDWTPLGVSTIMMSLFFGTNFFLFIFFQFLSKNERDIDSAKSTALAANKAGSEVQKKKLSKPFTGTLDCFTSLTSELFRTGLLMALTYTCENHWYLPHSTKSYSRDLFLFVVLLFFALALYTVKPIKDLSLLGREQTEEWKGWMQFIFLMYHYFHAEEVYNSVRVMITCYVWMTGFGNFSFFYMKRDFGWLRVVQMLWRLNFSVLLLMWTHGNTYILYYICPLHTFYFLVVYATMYLWSSLNHSKWGIRWKLLLVGIIIYVIWDINGGLFDILFFWLGTDKVIGANSGSVWEYYFRTSLDHYSTFFGMIFALNFPLAEQFFVRGRMLPLVLTGCLFAMLSLWWLVYVYTLEKLQYNLVHSYTAFIPLTSYIFFRNITPSFRAQVSGSLHDLGKTTLETYLLQHHVWLTSNAKTLLTIVPSMPWVNFFLASMLFLLSAKELYRLTMSLRGMILPDDHDIAWRNLLGTIAIVLFFFGAALLLHLFTPSLLEIVIASIFCSMISIILIGKVSKTFKDSPAFVKQQNFSMLLLFVAAIVCAILHFIAGVDKPSSNTEHDALLSGVVESVASYTAKKTGAMSFPVYGGITLLLGAVMIFTMDSFFGFGWITMALFGNDQLDWEDAYEPLLRKILPSSLPAGVAEATEGLQMSRGELKGSDIELTAAHTKERTYPKSQEGFEEKTGLLAGENRA